MKNTLLAVAIAVSGIVGAPVLSHAADTSGVFINGNIGESNLSKGVYDDGDTGFAGNIGYRWAVSPSVLLGVEGGYTDLGKISPKDAYSAFPEAKITGWTAGVNGHFNVSDNWYVSGRAGLFRADVKAAGLLGTSTPVLVDDTSNKYYAGAGFGYDFNNNLSVGVNYDYYKADAGDIKFSPNLVSVSAEYRF